MLTSAISKFLERRRSVRRQRKRRADPIGAFLAERTRRHDGSSIPASVIRREFAIWAEQNGFQLPHSRYLAYRLGELGYRKQAGRGGIYWLDIDLLIEVVR